MGGGGELSVATHCGNKMILVVMELVLYLDYGGGHMNQHVIKLHRTKHTYTQISACKTAKNLGGVYQCPG